MGRKRLLWTLIPSYLLISTLALVAVTLFALRSVQTFHFNQAEEGLEMRARIIEHAIAANFSSRKAEQLNQLCRDLGTATDTRITIMALDGGILGDSHAAVASMGNHANRPEMISALKGEVGSSQRYSHTLQEHLLYVAIPVQTGSEKLGVIRASLSLTALKAEQRTTLTRISWVGGGVLLLATVISFFVSRRLSQPLQAMTASAQKFAKGDFSTPVPVPESEELGQLAEAMNGMSDQINETIQTIEQQSNEQKAVLSSMAEGVLAVDTDERVITANQAVYKLLDLPPENVLSLTVQELIRNPDIQAFIKTTLNSQDEVEAEITLLSMSGDRNLHVHGTQLKGVAGRRLGALIVFHDVTRLVALENMRRDFVANVSHELKTPITTIKGFVETLLDGAMDEPENANRFLQIISRQSDRLTAIINDLLSLSRLEQQGGEITGDMQESSVSEMLKSGVEACLHKIQNQHMTVHIDVDDALRGVFKRDLLEQAVINLVDNAVKYSEDSKEVWVSGKQERGDLVIEIKDEGRGIPAEHLPRLFERFYRVDKARSREKGGTGLGLAIVKHIVQAHGGMVVADSHVGRGSTFRLRLPLRPKHINS